ncbi:AAA family ATPase [Candidatus Entotheonella palauensis]|nr:AAA family ATPase [Candidatus Entotheonella palauensis]
MAIRIDAKELRDVLHLTPPEQNIMLIGKHGIGKSEIIQRYYEREQAMTVVAFFLGQMSDPGDLIGLMHKEEHTGRSIFLPPYWWPVDGQPIVLFLDELNRARPEILQSVHELALNKTLAGKQLPPGSVVISAVNEGDEYQLTDLDPALVSRFNLYEFAPTVEDWLLWASEQGIDSRVIAFIQQYTQYLDGDATEHDADLLTAQAGLVKTPDRRAWVKVSQFLKPLQQIDDMHIKIIAGMVGTSAALAFKSSLSQALPITPEQVLLRFGRHKKTIDALLLQELVMLNDQIVLWVNSDQYTSKQEETARRNLLAYMRYLQETNKRETVAHLVSMLQSPKFDKAMTFAAASLEIIELLTAYIEGIKVE